MAPEELAFAEPPLEELTFAEPSIEAPSFEPAVEELTFAESVDLTFEEPAALEEPAAELTFEQSMFSKPVSPGPELAEDFSFADVDPAAVEEPQVVLSPVEEVEVLESAPAVDDTLFDVGELVLDDLPLEEIGEIDFYIEQELFDEARRKLEMLEGRFPGNADIIARRARLQPAANAAAPPVQRPSLLSRAEIESELLSAIPDEDDDLMPAPPPPVLAPAPPAEPVFSALVQEENLFADEDNFFDLAAELESELAEDEEQISLSEEEQSLEEIFKEFKKGVEQQLDSEDYDTHYNLGIAYKEMGLIDEAIGEFQLASKDPKRAVECASMLGLCFLEKGMPQLAIKWYRKGLEMPEITEEEHVGLLYDLGSAYQEVGDTESAQRAFMEVYGMNSNYRDTVSRIKALEDSRR